MRSRDMSDAINARVLRHALATGPVVKQGRGPSLVVGFR
jgi:hypothetical protein